MILVGVFLCAYLSFVCSFPAYKESSLYLFAKTAHLLFFCTLHECLPLIVTLTLPV